MCKRPGTVPPRPSRMMHTALPRSYTVKRPVLAEWWLDGTLASGAVEFVQPRAGQCVIHLHIRRNPLIYLVKTMATTVLTVLGSILTALVSARPRTALCVWPPR